MPTRHCLPFTLTLAAVLGLGACSHDPARAAADLLQEAHVYAQHGKYDSAVIEIRRALQIEPHAPAAYMTLAQVEMQQQNWPAAFAALRQVVDLDPQQLDARLDLARIYVRSRDFNHAVSAANIVLKAQPNNTAAWQVLATAAAASSHADEAEHDFRHIAQLTPSDPDAWINLGLADASLGQADGAATDFERAIAAAPHNDQAYIDLANLEHMRRRETAAQSALSRGLDAHPASVAIWMAKATLDYDPRQPALAQSDLAALQQRQRDAPEAALAVGQFQTAHGDLGAAIQTESAALAAHPRDTALQAQLLAAYLETEQWDPAQRLDDAVLRQDPKSESGQLVRAQLLLVRGQTKDALGILQPLATSHAGDYQVNYALAVAYGKAGQTLQAIHQAELALQLQPGAPECLGALAQLQLQDGQPAKAAPYAQQFLAATHASPAAQQLAGEVALGEHDYSAAIRAFQAAGLETSSVAQDHVMLAQAEEGDGQIPAAIAELQRAAALAPESSDIAGQIVHLDADHGDWSAAAAEITRFSRSRPNDANGPWLSATVAMARSQYDAARQDLQRALQMQPQFLQAKLDLGRVAQATGADPQALYWYQQALVQEPDFPPLLTLVGNLYLQQRQWGQAASYYQRALKAKPDFAPAEANLAWIDAQQNQNLSVALTLAQQADRSEPGVPSVGDTLAWVYYRLGSYGSAVPILRQCVTSDPGNATFRFHLGMALVANGDAGEGAATLRQALAMKLPPDESAQAQRALAAHSVKALPAPAAQG